MAKTKRPKGDNYPWDRWFSRKKIVLTEGKDFKCMAHSMIVQIRGAAASRSKSVSIKAGRNEKQQSTLTVTINDAK